MRFLVLFLCLLSLPHAVTWMNKPDLWFFQYDEYYQKQIAPQILPIGQTLDTSARVLTGQEEIYPKALEMIQEANSQILFDMYLFGGDIADAMLEILKAKHEAGVSVRLILPPVRRSERKEEQARSQLFATLYNEDPEDQTQEVYSYPAVEGFETLSSGEYVKPPYRPKVLKAIQMGLPIVHAETKFIPNSGMVRINHQKLLLVDGQRALIGGMNFATTVATNHDTMVEVAGPLVGELEKVFYNTWILGFAKGTEGILKYDNEKGLTDLNRLREQPDWHQGKAWVTLTAPYLKNTREELIRLIQAATTTIDIEQLLFNDTEVLKAVGEAAKRGVQVRMILDPAEHLYGFDWKGGPNNKAIGLAQSLMEKFPQVSMQVRHYRINPGQEMHCKLIVIDNTIVGLGSTNFTSGAFQSNYETFVFFDSPSLASAYTEFFNKDWATRSKEVEKLTGLKQLIGLFSDLLF